MLKTLESEGACMLYTVPSMQNLFQGCSDGGRYIGIYIYTLPKSG